MATIETLAERDMSFIRPLFISALMGALVHLVGKFLPFFILIFMTGGLTIYSYSMPFFDVTPYLDSMLPEAAFIMLMDPIFHIPGFYFQ